MIKYRISGSNGELQLTIRLDDLLVEDKKRIDMLIDKNFETYFNQFKNSFKTEPGKKPVQQDIYNNISIYCNKILKDFYSNRSLRGWLSFLRGKKAREKLSFDFEFRIVQLKLTCLNKKELNIDNNYKTEFNFASEVNENFLYDLNYPDKLANKLKITKSTVKKLIIESIFLNFIRESKDVRLKNYIFKFDLKNLIYLFVYLNNDNLKIIKQID